MAFPNHTLGQPPKDMLAWQEKLPHLQRIIQVIAGIKPTQHFSICLQSRLCGAAPPALIHGKQGLH